MAIDPASSAAPATGRERTTRGFLWVSVLAWGILLGAKIFDLRVLVGAWSAAPPESLHLLPYGPQYPVDTGEFFIPSSAALLVATIGAVLSGWRTPTRYRNGLLLSAAMILVTLVITVTVFWPRNAALWAVARHAPNALQNPEAIRAMVQSWVLYDWGRVAMGTIGFVASVRAISVPYPLEVVRGATTTAQKVLYAVALCGLLGFIGFFVSRM
jgi:hypothetical protein